MKALLDTNIIIHRESTRVVNQDIGILFKWLDRSKYSKCVHPVTLDEIKKNSNQSAANTIALKLESYEVLKTSAPMSSEVLTVSEKFDVTANDRADTILLNEIVAGRVEILISEDKKIHSKAIELSIQDRVFSISSFIEKARAENPALVNYEILSIKTVHFGNIDVNDSFFDSFKEDYPEFETWFAQKAQEVAYVAYNGSALYAFLYLKVEGLDENYYQFTPIFTPNKRLKVGTFKVLSNGYRISERFMKIIFDNALINQVEEIYFTIFDRTMGQQMLINMMEEWGFGYFGKKGTELVYVRKFRPSFDFGNPKKSYPYFSRQSNIFIVPIYPDYHTELLPDSYLKTESVTDYQDNEPHRNAISKVYICRSVERNIKSGDILLFYRTAASGVPAYYSSVLTTIGVVEEKIDRITDVNEFVLKCRKRSIFSDDELKKFWNYKPSFRPFIIKFLYVCSFTLGNRINRQRLLELGILQGTDGELRGLKQISTQQFITILKEAQVNENLAVN
jgi:predicted nucleic acid-binding protein